MKISNKKIMCLLCAVLAVVTLSSTAGQALSSWTKSIDVYTGVKIYIDDQRLEPTDVNGNPVEPFIYNGTTYLPVRALSQALGKLVQWDGETSSVYVGKHESDKPAVWLADVEPDEGKLSSYLASARDTSGYTHYHILAGSSATYVIDGKYRAISGVLFQMDGYEDDYPETTLNIFGDGELLYTASVHGKSKTKRLVDPVQFKIDITGVKELTVEISKYSGRGLLGDCGLWS